MEKYKGSLSLIGFLLFLFGFITLILSMVGMKLIPFLWMDYFSPIVSFLIKVLMILFGIVLVVLARRGEDTHDDFFDMEEV